MVEKRENRQKRIKEEMEFMQEMEYMRVQAKVHFPSDFDSMKIREEALDEKYDYECSIALMKTSAGWGTLCLRDSLPG